MLLEHQTDRCQGRHQGNRDRDTGQGRDQAPPGLGVGTCRTGEEGHTQVAQVGAGPGQDLGIRGGDGQQQTDQKGDTDDQRRSDQCYGQHPHGLTGPDHGDGRTEGRHCLADRGDRHSPDHHSSRVLGQAERGDPGRHGEQEQEWLQPVRVAVEHHRPENCSPIGGFHPVLEQPTRMGGIGHPGHNLVDRLLDGFGLVTHGRS